MESRYHLHDELEDQEKMLQRNTKALERIAANFPNNDKIQSLYKSAQESLNTFKAHKNDVWRPMIDCFSDSHIETISRAILWHREFWSANVRPFIVKFSQCSELGAEVRHFTSELEHHTIESKRKDKGKEYIRDSDRKAKDNRKFLEDAKKKLSKAQEEFTKWSAERVKSLRKKIQDADTALATALAPFTAGGGM